MNEHYSFEECEKINSCVKQILFMYWDFLRSGNMTSDIVLLGEFDPFEMVDYSTKNTAVYINDIKLINEASAVKILVKIVQSWMDCGDVTSTRVGGDIQQLLDGDKLRKVPEFKRYIKESLVSEKNSWTVADQVYQEYVVEYFKYLGTNQLFLDDSWYR